jgi:hypothetical protein
MKRFCPVLLIIILLGGDSYGQKMTFSDYTRKDSRDMKFEILGRFGSNYLVYKNIQKQHMVTRYDADMHVADLVPLDFMPDRTINADFVTYPDFFYIIYQHQKNSIVYCYAVKIGADGNKLSEPKLLDTTRIGFFADNKIYNTIASEDKKKILIYKRSVKFDFMTVVTRLYDADLSLIDSTRQHFLYDDRKETYSDIYVDNNGTFVYAKEMSKTSWDNASNVEVITRTPGVDSFRRITLSLDKKYVEDVAIKIDNLNRNYIINSFYYASRRGSVAGLFTARIDMDGIRAVKSAFNVFSDSLRIKMNSSEQYKFVFDNLSARNIVVKKNGGFIIVAEDFYTETLSTNNAWNRNYYNGYNSYWNDYYSSSPYYYGYRPYGSYYGNQSIRYYYDDIVIASIDSSLKLEWNNLIHKKQYDVDNDNFMSYSILNAGGEIHFLFIDKNKQKEIISNHSIFPNGELKRYPTLKSNERGYEFMPRLAKQVGASQVILPYLYLGKVGFVKIDF